MDLQNFFNAISDSAARVRSNYHLTLGKLVEALANEQQHAVVSYDFGGHPSAPVSYRGYYSDLSFPPADGEITVGELIQLAKDAIGQTFEGYKGGDFTMTETTPLWAAGYGMGSGWAIVGLRSEGQKVTLITKRIDD